ncbi:hypothetical protein CDAR_105871 [Caerostris darwini]|uniref:Uncharacterized protein n=1 Tax=Caerostris darwini TaxID=1538125 RepID=A0AAV4TSA9_9ARAC|nr:hypothetical protein CDAR_105871 [Caerostris darwini]
MLHQIALFVAQHLENEREREPLFSKLSPISRTSCPSLIITSLFQFSRLEFKIVWKPYPPLFPYTLPSSEGEESNVLVQVEGEISLCKSRKPLNCAVRFSYAKMYSSEFEGLL